MSYSSDCRVCFREVSKRCKGLACGRCQDWYHIGCISIPSSCYKGLNNDRIFWFCGRCVNDVKSYLDNFKTKDSAEKSDNIGKEEDSRTQDSGSWKTVTDGVKPRPSPSKVEPVIHNNRFALLGESGDDPEVELFGDSMIRDQHRLLKKRTNRKCAGFCYPGAGVEKISSVLVEQSGSCPVIVSVGTNNVKTVPSEILKQKYLKILEQLQERRNGILCGILPRMKEKSEWCSRAIGLNNWLSQECSHRDIVFVDLWHKFIRSPWLYSRDGIHLNYEGKTFFSDVLGELLEEFPFQNFLA